MKILFVTNSTIGGYGYAIVGRNVIKGLREKGHHVANTGMQTIGAPVKDKYDNLNIPVRYAAWMQDSLEDYIRCHEPDVLVTMFDIWPQECSYIPDVVRRTRVPWVHHITINSVPFSPYLAERIPEAKVVVNPSKFSYRMMDEAGHQKIAYIPHGVDTSIYKPLSDEEKTRIKKDLDIEDKFCFLCVNRNKGMQKAFWILFRAYKKFLANVKDAKKKTVLLFCCDPLEPEPGNHNLIALRQSMNMTENVRFIKAKPNKEWTKVKIAKEDDPKAFYHHANYGFEEEEMRKIFGIADVHCITSEGESFCLLPETKIFTDDKIKKIEEVSMNDKVISDSGELANINKIMRFPFDGNIIEIKTFGQPESIKITPNHRVLVSKKGRKIKNTEWIEAQKIEKGDLLFLPSLKTEKVIKEYDLSLFDVPTHELGENIYISVKYSKKESKTTKLLIPKNIKINEDLAKLFGWYISEGGSTKHSISFSFNSKEINYINEVKECFLKIFPNVSICEEINNNKHNIFFTSKVLANFFSKTCGAGAKNKKIPKEILFGEQDLLKLCIERIFMGDGHKNKNIYILSTSSETLANQTKIGLIRLGFSPTLRKSTRFRKFNTNDIFKSTEYSLTYYPEERSKHSIKSFIYQNKTAYRVREINTIKYSGDVFDLEVDKNHTYCTIGFVVHNSLPVIESCACGIPNIFPNHTTGPELVGEPKTGLLTKILMEHATPMLSDVAITDENDVAEKMILLYQDEKLRKELEKNALEFAKGYSWDKIIDKWDKLLRTVPYLV